ncbi:MAG: aldo/keto reductase [Oscillospiraceae bacterium]|nr:aldo/keto reductase [Oscillospiraceae bacterium]
MQYRKLGNTGLKVSYLGIGASSLGDMYGKADDDEAVRMVDAAIDSGINFFDVAPSYGPRGLAEERLGKALAGKRGKVILNTKIGREDYGTTSKPAYAYDYTPEKVRSSIEDSLRRLRTDYIDVYQVHDFTNIKNHRYIAEYTIPEMRKLQAEGKIRYIGINSSSIDALIALASMTPVDTILNFLHYTLVDQSLGERLSPYARANGIGLINASILHMGLLTPTVRALYGWNRDWEGKPGKIREAVLEANKYCEGHGFSISDAAIRYAMDYDGVDSTLIGIGRMSSLERSLKALDKEIGEEHMLHIINMLKVFNEN